jgi:hypothetical protein
VGGAGRVVDARAALGVGGVVGTTWGTTEVVGATRGAAKVDEAGDKEAMKGQAV